MATQEIEPVDPDKFDTPVEVEFMKAIVPMIADKFAAAHTQGMEHKVQIAEIQAKDNREARKHAEEVLHAQSELERKHIETTHAVSILVQNNVWWLGLAIVGALVTIVCIGAWKDKLKEIVDVIEYLVSLAAVGYGLLKVGEARATRKRDQQT